MGNSPARVAVDVGTVIDGTYTIEGLIGRGGMGQVFVASHNRLPGRKVAIKLLHEGNDDADILRRFAREAEIASKLGHPNIVGVVDIKQLADGTPYLVLEYLQGESLAQRLKAGPISLPQIISILRQVGSALAAAHREGIVHRDLKPQNIFLCPTEVDGRMIEIAKVLDFGISKIRGSDTVKTQESSLLGTPQYMAPEQATGQHSTVDERTDIFALGAIIYEMCTGQPAFSGASIPEVVFKVVYEQPKPLHELAPDVPANVVAAVDKALAKPAQDRFASVGELVEALTGTPLATLSVPPMSPPDIGFADGSGHRSGKAGGQEAFAQTMDSGTGAAPAPIQPTPVPPRSSTVESQPGAKAVFTSSIREPASTQAARRAQLEVAETGTALPAAPAPSRVPLIAIVLGVVAIAAIVAFVVMRDDDKSAPAIASASDASAIDAEPIAAPIDAPIAAPIADAAPIDAAPMIAVDAGARVKPARDAGPRPEKPPVEPDEPEDANLTEYLKTAESALARGNDAGAKQGANKIIDAVDSDGRRRASKRQLARAYGIRGSAACKSADLGDATSDLQALNGLIRRNRAFLTFRTRMLSYCHGQGQLLDIK